MRAYGPKAATALYAALQQKPMVEAAPDCRFQFARLQLAARYLFFSLALLLMKRTEARMTEMRSFQSCACRSTVQNW
jgi:hypothetical protein